MLQNELLALGLTKSEARTYLFLLEHGLATPSQIAKGTGIMRTNSYHILQSLEAQSLIQPQTHGKRRAYLARDPEALFRSIEAKRETISRILPDLRGIYTTQKNKPKIQFYDGLAQIKEVYVQSLEAEEIFAIGSTRALDAKSRDLYRWYIGEVKKRNIVFHDVLTQASRKEAGPLAQSVLKGLYDVKYLPEKYGDVPTDLLIWGDQIGHITLEEPVFATVIANPLLAKTMKTLFSVISEGI